MSKVTKKKKAARLKELRRIHGPDYGKVECPECHRMVEPKNIVKGEPDPFASEIGGDNTIVEQCRDCYNESCSDI